MGDGGVQFPGGLLRVSSSGSHMWGVREIPLGAQTLGDGIGKMQGGFRKLGRARGSTPGSSKAGGIRCKWWR